MEPIINKFKVTLVGDKGTGKTCLIDRLVYDQFDNNKNSTVGIDFISKTIVANEKTVRLQLWDTAGQERFRSLIPSYLRDASGVILVYDITDIGSFRNMSNWYREAKEHAGNVPIVLVASKKELEKEKMATSDEGNQFAEEIGAEFFEVSSKTGEGVKDVFDCMIEKMQNPGAGRVEKKPKDTENDPNTYEKGLYFSENENEKQWDFAIQILLLGDSSSGKSSVLTRYVENTFNEVSIASEGIVNRTKTIKLSGKVLRLTLLDTPGDPKSIPQISDHYRTSNAVVLMYDVTNPSSFDLIKTWHKEIAGALHDDARVWVVGNKLDMETERKVLAIDAKRYAQEQGASYIEVSAKTNQNIEEAFVSICGEVLAAY